MPQRQVQHITPSSTKGHADSEFVGALRDGAGNHAVNSGTLAADDVLGVWLPASRNGRQSRMDRKSDFLRRPLRVSGGCATRRYVVGRIQLSFGWSTIGPFISDRP